MLVEFEYWWLLILPLFFTLGWIAARVDIKQLIAESTSLPATYFKGLNLLIADQYHKAVDAFSEALYLNKDSLELHFVLGSLFRRTGETDRAIHLHMNLLENYELTDQQSTSIKVELAQDYFKAGLYDRAEELFQTLRHTRYEQAAQRHLLEIYVKEREWSQAIAIATELEGSSGISYRKEIAQYSCELAVNAIIQQNWQEAKYHLEQALDANKNCVRANVLLGDMAAQQEDHAAAIAFWKRIEMQDPEYLGLVAQKMLKSYAALPDSHATAEQHGIKGLKEGLTQLNLYLETYQLSSIMSVLYEATLQAEGAETAAKLARNELIRKPSLKSLDQLLQARAILDDEQHDLQLMQQTVRNAIGDRAAYYCDQCGFRAKQYHWQCPACNAWESLPAEPTEATIRDIKLLKRK
ncbi:lipopolysaccharide assembly protein LapB [Methylophilus sp. Leaf414]|uniref:lipopolysaccharide assembly protein LapB n=1 Tax=Methylophilus sp. Leaf414 TaxID=1736371 RepID=UPI0006FE282E|nr:lipopolysaccharide assembly protein LapB [Methylophilus sp. Leaf414]KQT34522.1 N-acetylglucosaminyl transferase [Methylophilus sp. Leaf414]